MQEDYTVFKIPASAESGACDFDAVATPEVTNVANTVTTSNTATVVTEAKPVYNATATVAAETTPVYDTTTVFTYAPTTDAQKPVATFAFYDELNQIAEELEKCRLRNS